MTLEREAKVQRADDEGAPRKRPRGLDGHFIKETRLWRFLPSAMDATTMTRLADIMTPYAARALSQPSLGPDKRAPKSRYVSNCELIRRPKNLFLAVRVCYSCILPTQFSFQ